MSDKPKIYPLNETWDLSHLLPGAAGAETYAEKDAVIQSLMGKHTQEIARFNGYIAEWNDGSEPFDLEQLHDMVDYLQVFATHQANIQRWIFLHKMQDGETPEVLAHAQCYYDEVEKIQESYGRLYHEVGDKVVGVQEDLRVNRPVMLRTALEVFNLKPTSYFSIPMISGIEYSKEIEPYEEYQAIYRDTNGFADLDDAARNGLAEALTKAAQNGIGNFAARGSFSPDDFLQNYESNYGIPKQLMQDFTAPEKGFPVHPIPRDVSKAGAVTWEETQLALRKVFSQFPGGEAMLDAALGEGWICSAKNSGRHEAGYSVPDPKGSRKWTGSHSYIYMPFDGSAFSATGIAHELGHALQQEYTALHNPNEELANLAFAETFSTVAERLMDRALLEVVAQPKRQVMLAHALSDRTERIVTDHAILARVSQDVMQGVIDKDRKEPFNAEEIGSIISKRCNEVYQEDRAYFTDPTLTRSTLYDPIYGPAQANCYGVAVLAAQGWVDRYFELPEAERKDMAAEWVEVMKSSVAYEKDLAGAMARVGVDIGEAGFTDRCMDSMHEWRVAAETGFPVPDENFREAGGEGTFAANENKRRKQESSVQRVRG